MRCVPGLNFILICLLSIVAGCGRQDVSPSSSKENQSEDRPDGLSLPRQASPAGLTIPQLFIEAEIYASAGYEERALALLDILEEKFPDAREIEDARDLRSRLRIDSHSRHAKAEEPVTLFSGTSDSGTERKEDSVGVITGLIGAGGTAGGMSLSAELNRITRRWLFGAGASWMQTSDVKTLYYVDTPSVDPGATNLGDYNEGDEYEVYAVLGRRQRERLFICASLGLSRQTIVNMEKMNATNTLYVAGRRTEQYLNFSAQLRYQAHRAMALIIGYHTRRGAVGGLSVRW